MPADRTATDPPESRRGVMSGFTRVHPPDRHDGARQLPAAYAVAAIVVSLLFYLWWEVVHRGIYAYSTAAYRFDDADEWRYTACSRLVVHGYRMFDQVFSAQPPLFFLSLASSMRVFGESIAGARGAGVAFGVVALTATAWVAWELAGSLAAGVAAAALGVSPGFLLYAHAVEAEVPMMALVTLALALALAYRRVGRLWILVFAGLTMAAAVLIKFFALEAVLPVMALLVTMHRPIRATVTAAAAFGVAAALPVLAEFALVSPADQWQQVVTLHNRAAGLRLPGLIPAATIVREFLVLDLGLSLLAAAGLAMVVLQRRAGDTAFLALWSLGTIVMLLIFRPLFPHHAAILTASLAVSAGVAVASVVPKLRGGTRVGWVPVAVLSLAYLACVPRLIHADRHTLVPVPQSSVTVLAAYVDRTTSPGVIVAADNVEIAELAHRLVPPPLCDPSNVRLLAGEMTSRQLIAATVRYRAQLVIPVGNFRAVDAYMRWLRAHYSPIMVGGVTVFRLASHF